MRKTVNYLLWVLIVLASFNDEVYARYNPNITWRVVRTRNFTIYYPEGHEAFAGRVVSLTDEVFSDITGYFGVTPRHVPVVLHPHTDLFNGFYSPFPNRISLFETPENNLKGFGSSTRDLIDLVFTHEYTHYTHITTSRGLFGLLSRVFGEGLCITNGLSPGWAIEGITTNLETRFTDGGRGRSPYFRGVMRSFSGRSSPWSLSAAGTISTYAPPPGRIYLGGYYMVEYLNRTYGEDTFARLSLYQAKHPLRGTGRALKQVTNKSPGTFYRDFLDDFTSRCDSIRTVTALHGLPDGRTLLGDTLDGYKTHFWTDRGTIMALRSGYEKPATLMEINPVTGKTIKEIRTGTMFNHKPVRMLSDGRLFFGETFFHPLGEGELNVSDLVIFDPETRHRERLTHDAHIYSADISPDGKTFVAVRRNGMWTELVLLDADGTNIRTLFSKPGVYFESPSWAPDGETIAVTVKVGGNTDIALVNAETGGIQTIFASDAYGNGDPSFSPDGRWIVFSSAREGIWNIYARDMNNHHFFQLTSVFTGAFEPRISPDGRTLSFLVISEGKKEIRVIPFRPEVGHLVHVGPGGRIEEPDLERIQPSVAMISEGISLWEANKPFINMPYWGEDKDGSSVGVFLMGGDPVGLNAYDGAVFYGTGSERLGYNIHVRNRSFWPTVSILVYDFIRKESPIRGSRKHWFKELGSELAFSLDVLHRTVPSVLSASYSMGTRLRRFDNLESIQFDRDHDQSFSFFAEVFLERIPDAARRDMVPGWGQGFYLGREEELTVCGGEIRGHNMEFIGRQFIPSPIKHHGFEFTIAHQNQRGILFFDKGDYIPRGYSTDDTDGGLNLRKTLTVSLEYRYPLLFIDKGIGVNLLHFHLLRGALITDYGAGWSGDFQVRDWGHKAQISIGATLTDQTHVLSFVPLEFGICAGYKPRDDAGFLKFILDIWSKGLADRKKLRKTFFFTSSQ